MADAKESMKDIPPDSTLHLQAIDRVKNLPTVDAAVGKICSAYSSAKGWHPLINWALTQTEANVQHVAAKASNLGAPLVKDYEQQISAVDKKLCDGLNVIEQHVPIISKPPEEIYETGKAVVSNTLQPVVDKWDANKESMKEISMSTANQLLNTRYGNMAMKGLDSANTLANSFLGAYSSPGKSKETPPASLSTDDNQALHAIQTMSELSTKMAWLIGPLIIGEIRSLSLEDVAYYVPYGLLTLRIIKTVSRKIVSIKNSLDNHVLDS